MLEQDLGLLVIRLVVGLIFVAHGAQKVLGVWGGPGLVGWTGAMEHMGFRPARYWALLDAGVEFGCGILFTIGFLTPIAAAALLGLFEIVLTADEQGVGRFTPALVWSIALCLIILATSKSGSMQSLPDKVKGAVRTIGLMTYPVYLIHYDFGGLCLRELYALGISVWPAVAIAVLTVLGVSYGIVAFAEPAIRRRLRNVLERTESRWQ